MNCYVIDDELFAAEMIAVLIRKTPGLELIGIETDDEVALKKLLSGEIIADVIFLDIELKKSDGVSFALKVKHLTHVVFVTGHVQYAIAAIDHGITDYLVKPVSYKRFMISVDRVKEALLRKTPHRIPQETLIPIRHERKILVLKPEEVIYIESRSNYLKFYLTGDRIQGSYMVMNELCKALLSTSIVRVHRSYMVNIKRVTAVNGNLIQMEGDFEIQLSRSYRDVFLKRLNVR